MDNARREEEYARQRGTEERERCEEQAAVDQIRAEMQREVANLRAEMLREREFVLEVVGTAIGEFSPDPHEFDYTSDATRSFETNAEEDTLCQTVAGSNKSSMTDGQ